MDYPYPKVPYVAPKCSHQLHDGNSARCWRNGICSLCSQPSPILGLFPLTSLENQKRKR